MWLGTRAQLEWQALDWTYTSAEFTAQLRFPAIVAAGAAAHVAARLTHRTRIFAQPWSVRVGHPLLRRHLGQLLGWFLPAYLLGMAPLVWATARHASYGHPHALVVVGALTGLAALVALGYLTGALVQNVLAVPLTVALVFLLLGLPNLHDGWNAVVPTLSALPTLGREQSLDLGLYRLLAFTVFGALFWSLAARLLTRRPPAAAHAPLLLVPVVLVALPLLRTPALFTYAGDGREVCDTRGTVTYCVHEGHRAELAELRDLAAPVIAAYGPDRAPLRQVRDDALAGAGTGAHRPDTLWVPITPGWRPAEEVPPLVASTLLPGRAACVSPTGSIAAGAATDERRTHLLQDLALWLQSRAFPGGGTDAGLFSGVAPERVRQWLARDRHAVETCTADPEDLPWR
ncbi:hypothetical protein GCM10023237_34690 [Streptomyces coeruleoprunus]